MNTVILYCYVKSIKPKNSHRSLHQLVKCQNERSLGSIAVLNLEIFAVMNMHA